MALIKCPECGAEISDTCKQCPHCGYKLLAKQVNLAEETKVCPRCGKSVPKRLIKCPNCGKRFDTKPIVIVIAITVVIVLLSALGNTSGDADKTTIENVAKTSKAEQTTMSKEKFIAKCKEYNYKDLARNPEKYNGVKIKLEVKINQKMSEFDDTSYRALTNDKYNMWTGDEYVILDIRGKGAVKLLEDDVITLYGTYSGTKNMTRSLTGTTVEIPCIDMLYCDLK